MQAAVELCEALMSAWEPALGASPRRAYLDGSRAVAGGGGRGAGAPPAGTVAARAGLHARRRDPRVPGRVTHPGFAEVADQLLARHHARSRRSRQPARAATAGGVIGWRCGAGAARARCARATAVMTVHGALAELSEHSDLFAVRRAGAVEHAVRAADALQRAAATPSSGASSPDNPPRERGRQQHERDHERPCIRPAGVPPHNLEAERRCSARCCSTSATSQRSLGDERLRPEHFYREQHAAVFAAMLALHDRRRKIDHLTVTEALRERGKLDQVGGAGAVEELAAGCPPAATPASTGGSCATTRSCARCYERPTRSRRRSHNAATTARS